MNRFVVPFQKGEKGGETKPASKNLHANELQLKRFGKQVNAGADYSIENGEGPG